MQFDIVIGLEVHAQLATKSKLFSDASTSYGASPNTQASLIDAGLPGVLPVLNKQAVEMAVRFGYAIDANINDLSYFERKNYFYPDLPKGYQISQLQRPIVESGHLDIQTEQGVNKIRINRAHLEEDAGKSLHEDFHGYTGIDLNRAGIPLLEIVTEPDMTSAEEAIAYLKTLHRLVRYLGICDGNMQEGSFRCDVNLSLKPAGSQQLGTRTELKNINSFKFIAKAIACEASRHEEILESGGSILQETRLYDPNKDKTYAMRSKEEANDYRYFPCPDLLPIKLDDELLTKIKNELPELPEIKQQRLQTQYDLGDDEIDYLLQDASSADYFEKTSQLTNAKHKMIVNWMRGEFAAFLNKHNSTIAFCQIDSRRFAQLLDRIQDDTLSSKMAKTVFEHLWNSTDEVDTIIENQGLKQVNDDSQLEGIINDILAQNPAQVEQFKQGKTKMLGFFVGQVMKATKGQANPKQVNELLSKLLNS